jgi:hypothetical protein
MNKQKFTRVDGSRGLAQKVSAMPELQPGHWWINQAPMGAGFNHWVETPMPIAKGKK